MIILIDTNITYKWMANSVCTKDQKYSQPFVLNTDIRETNILQYIYTLKQTW